MNWGDAIQPISVTASQPQVKTLYKIVSTKYKKNRKLSNVWETLESTDGKSI